MSGKHRGGFTFGEKVGWVAIVVACGVVLYFAFVAYLS